MLGGKLSEIWRHCGSLEEMREAVDASGNSPSCRALVANVATAIRPRACAAVTSAAIVGSSSVGNFFPYRSMSS